MMIFTKDCFTMTKCHIMLLTSYHMDQCTFMYKKPNQTNTMWHVLHQNNTNTSVFRCFSVFANTQYRKWLQPTILTLTLTERVPLINYWWLFSIILNVFDDSSRVTNCRDKSSKFVWMETIFRIDILLIPNMFLISVKSSAKNERNRLKLCRKWETL